MSESPLRPVCHGGKDPPHYQCGAMDPRWCYAMAADRLRRGRLRPVDANPRNKISGFSSR
jgi:hypothetical protein